jgi:hypothetical protein
MIILLETGVFIPKFGELGADHVILPDLLVNRPEGGVEREHCSEDDHKKFSVLHVSLPQ